MGGFSGAVLVAREGRVILRKGYGFSDVERRVPFTPATQHLVASVSKMFTAMAALELRDAGRLDLDAPISTYLPDAPAAWDSITSRHLIHHTSGIPDYEERLEIGSEKYFAFMTRPEASREIYEQAKRDTLEFEPGTKFHYSNSAYIVLSHVIERAAGRPFADVVRTQLLEPAGMKSSGVNGVGKPPAHLAVGYTHRSFGWDTVLAGLTLDSGHLRRVPKLPLLPPEGDAWLYSTVDDLYRWSQVMDGGKLIEPSEVAEAFTPGLGDYGAGWFISAQALGRRRVRHNGILPGYVCDFVKFPDDRATIIIVSNLDRSRLQRIARDLSALLFGQPYDMPVRGKVVALTHEQTTALEGHYRMTDGKSLDVRKEPEFLTAAIKDQFTAGLIPLSPTRFYMPLSDGIATFELGADGRAARVNLHYSGEDHFGDRAAP